MRRLVALLVALGILWSVSGAGGSATAAGNPSTAAGGEQVVRIHIGSVDGMLDPGIATNPAAHTVDLALFEGLMRLDTGGRPVPGLAEAMPTVSPDGLTLTFKIRRDARWSNGDPVTADDFVWTWRRNLDPRTGSAYAFQLYYIKGGADLNVVPLTDSQGKVPRPDAAVAADVAKAMANLGVRALDARTLEVKLEIPAPFFLSLLAFPTLMPLHQSNLKATAGPFKLDRWDAQNGLIAVVRNPLYYDAAKVKLDRVEFYTDLMDSDAVTRFEAGQMDVVTSGLTDVARLQRERPAALQVLPDIATYFYRFNVTKPPFNDVRVRKALALALDRSYIVKNVMGVDQVPALAFVPPGIPDVNDDFRKNGGTYFKDNDIATAKKLLAEAGYPDGQGFPVVELLYNTNDSHKAIAQAVQNMWAKNLGVKSTLRNVEWILLQNRTDKLDYQVVKAGWLGDYIDPTTFLDMFVTNGWQNRTGWSNHTYDYLVWAARTAQNPQVRSGALHLAEQVLMDDMPIIPVYFYVRRSLVDPRLKGWSWPVTSGFNLRDAYWQK